MKAKIIFASSLSIGRITACNNNDEHIKNAVSVNMYNANHGMTNLSNTNVYLFFSLQNMQDDAFRGI